MRPYPKACQDFSPPPNLPARHSQQHHEGSFQEKLFMGVIVEPLTNIKLDQWIFED
jgi:hypothetical protein